MKKKVKPLEKLNLPRGYISPSQLSLWRSSKEKYRERYYEGKDGYVNDAMRFGSKLANRIDGGEETDDPLIELLVTGGKLKLYEKREYPLTWYTPNGVKVYGKLDTSSEDYHHFREFKTGTVPWTQRKANAHPQTRIYLAGIYTNLGVFAKAHLDWIPTEKREDGTITLADREIVSLELEIGIAEIYEVYREIEKVAQEIAEDYTNYQNQLI